MSSFMRGSAPPGPPPSTQSNLTALNASVREIRTQLTALTEAISTLSGRVDVQQNSLRDGVVAAAAVLNTVATRVGNLEHAAACAEATAGELPERPDDDDVVGRVLEAMDAHNVPAAAPVSEAKVVPQLNTTQRLPPRAAAPAPDASLPPPPPPPPVFNRPANATGVMLSGVRRRKWGVA